MLLRVSVSCPQRRLTLFQLLKDSKLPFIEDPKYVNFCKHAENIFVNGLSEILEENFQRELREIHEIPGTLIATIVYVMKKKPGFPFKGLSTFIQECESECN
jgi:hypothetical protein